MEARKSEQFSKQQIIATRDRGPRRPDLDYLVSYKDLPNLEAEPKSTGGMFWVYAKNGRQLGRYDKMERKATFFSEWGGSGWKSVYMENCKDLKEAMTWLYFKTLRQSA